MDPRPTFRSVMMAFLALFAWGASVGEAGAQTVDAATSPELLQVVALPVPVEITRRARAVADSAAQAQREIADLVRLAGLEAEVAAGTRRQAELQQFLQTLMEAEYLRPERIARVRDQAIQEEQRIQSTRERALDRMESLDRVRGEWLERRTIWTSWREGLRGEPDFALVEPEIGESLGLVDAVLESVGAALGDLIPLQRDVESLRRANDDVLARVQAIRLGRRAALLRQVQPVLFSAEYNEQLRQEPWEEWRPLSGDQPAAWIAFARENALLIVAHLLLLLALAIGGTRLGRVVPRDNAWEVALAHPFAFAIFGSTALVVQRYALAPPLWDVVTWTLLAGSAVVLTKSLFRWWSLRLMVYFFALFYPLFLLGEALRLPEPLFRLALSTGSAVGLLVFIILARRASSERGGSASTGAALWLGSALIAFIFLAEVLGFYLLARWIAHATVTSGLVVFTVWLLFVLARAATTTIAGMQENRNRFLQNVGFALAEKLLVLFQIFLVIAAVLVVLDVWELAVSPVQTWSRITSAGFTMAGVEVTLGRVLTAVVMVYLAVLASWTTRAFIDTEVAPRWSMERGVGDSINSLLHYTILTIGVVLALGAIGVHLQNFAIIAGALGIGIGFGLQNIVNNFVSGLILLFERPVRVGDTVVIGGEWGTVKKIGLRSTVVVTFDQSELIVPNADLVSEKVTNWTLSNPVARLVLPVGVAYGTDVERVLQILREVATSHPAVLTEPAPSALFVNFGDSSLDFELRVWVCELRERLAAKSMLLTQIDRRFRAEGIEIPFPQRDLHLRSVDAGLVRDALSEVPGRGDGVGESPG